MTAHHTSDESAFPGADRFVLWSAGVGSESSTGIKPGTGADQIVPGK
jgi:hypothetical protein